jgi:hypothetical protein
MAVEVLMSDEQTSGDPYYSGFRFGVNTHAHTAHAFNVKISRPTEERLNHIKTHCQMQNALRRILIAAGPEAAQSRSGA